MLLNRARVLAMLDRLEEAGALACDANERIREMTPDDGDDARRCLLGTRRETGLAHAGYAEGGEELAGAVVCRLLESVPQSPELGLAADHRSREAAC